MSIPKPSDWKRWCDEMAASWAYLGRVGPEMIRLAKMPTTTADGFPFSTGGERVSAQSELTSTERAAFDDGQDDWVGRHLEALFRSVREARAATSRAHAAAVLVEHRGDRRFGRQATGGDCLACHRFVSGAVNDKLKAGYCTVNPGCYSAWRRYRETEEAAGREPSHEGFRRRRLAELRPTG